jgi:Ni,Fe-hydrogenase I cytochrome b subunit
MAGLILILVPTIEYGGYFLLKSLLGPASQYIDKPLVQNFERAGHAHAGVIILLSLIVQILVDHATLPGLLRWFVRLGVPISAMLVSAGFFLSVMRTDPIHTTQLVNLVYAGAVLLAAAVLLLAVGLLRAPSKA